jgi:hypothetical protein
MRVGLWSVSVATALLSAAAEASVAIDHGGVGCIVAEQFPRFEAHLDPVAEVSRARLHFRPKGGPHWYSVAMKTEGDAFVGVLPKPKKTLKRLDYYIEATDRSFGTSRTAEFSPEVASGPVACKNKVVAGALSTASVVIEGPAGAPLVPVGFEPTGVVAVAGSPDAGQAPGATSQPANAASGVGGNAAAGGLGAKPFIIGGAVAVGAGVAIAVAHGSGSGGSSSSAGAGAGSSGSGSGACQASPITSSLTGAPLTLRCGQAFNAGIVVSNGSCSALSVQAVQLTHQATAAPFCSAFLAQYSFNPGVSSVASGRTTTVLNYVSAPFCCPGGPCPGTATCAYDETFVVLTSAGPVSSGTAPVQVSFDPSCPICPP